MTNGEAINWIINISADIGKVEHRDLWHYEQALSEIREILEQECKEQECEKCIFRPFKQFQPEPHWIPCSERLPEDLEEVNVTWVNHDPEPYYNFVKDKPFTATAVYYKEKWYWYSSTCAGLLAEYGRNPNQEIDDGIEITAWMPLPEPWRGEAKCTNAQ